MRWSYRLGRLAGINVNIHITFTLLIAWLLLAHWMSGQTSGDFARGLAFIAAIFSCVLLHELGHALAARRFGIATRDITLLPIGGVARLERMPEEPKQELYVALAGPIVNVLIAAVLYVWLVLTSQFVPLNQLGIASGSFVERLLVVNILLIVFNMLPAFPMDGGRCVRALLAMKLEYAQATRIAAAVGQAIAVVFVILGLFSNPFLLLIGVFVWIGAAGEARYATINAAIRGVPVHHALLRAVPLLAPTHSLAKAAQVMCSGSLNTAIVQHNGRPIGTLDISRLIECLRRYGQMKTVGDVMRRDVETLELPATLDTALARLRDAKAAMVSALDDGRFVGVITLDSLERFVETEKAMQHYSRTKSDIRSPTQKTAWPVDSRFPRALADSRNAADLCWVSEGDRESSSWRLRQIGAQT
jgi:Zn-dependent protease